MHPMRVLSPYRCHGSDADFRIRHWSTQRAWAIARLSRQAKRENRVCFRSQAYPIKIKSRKTAACGFDLQEGKLSRNATCSLCRLCARLRTQKRGDFLTVAVEFLHRTESPLEQQRHVVQYAFDDFLFPLAVELDLLVQPGFEPIRIRQTALHRIVRKQCLVDMQISRMQRLFRTAGGS